MTEQEQSATSRRYDISLRRAFIRAFIPVFVVLPFALWALPTHSPEGGIYALERYQQIASVSVTVSVFWSLYRFHKITEDHYQEPEERVLEE